MNDKKKALVFRDKGPEEIEKLDDDTDNNYTCNPSCKPHPSIEERLRETVRIAKKLLKITDREINSLIAADRKSNG